MVGKYIIVKIKYLKPFYSLQIELLVSNRNTWNNLIVYK